MEVFQLALSASAGSGKLLLRVLSQSILIGKLYRLNQRKSNAQIRIVIGFNRGKRIRIYVVTASLLSITQ